MLTTDPVIWKATELAVVCHEGQTRKGAGTTPYITHPIRVGLYLAQAGLSPEIVAAGLLHDTIEETSPLERQKWAEKLEASVGPRVLELVRAVSDSDPESSWHDRKVAYLEHLKAVPVEALAVSCADKLDNTLGLAEVLRTTGPVGLTRFNSPIESKIQYHREVTSTAESRWPECPLIVPLREALDVLEQEVSRQLSATKEGGA
jgi:(p)ppGpp synthase/HD superfamily hydrolase